MATPTHAGEEGESHATHVVEGVPHVDLVHAAASAVRKTSALDRLKALSRRPVAHQMIIFNEIMSPPPALRPPGDIGARAKGA